MDSNTNVNRFIPNEEQLNCINKISEAVIQFTSEKSKLWFGKALNLEECKTIFKNNYFIQSKYLR